MFDLQRDSFHVSSDPSGHGAPLNDSFIGSSTMAGSDAR
jgi:hypothetical protein